MRGHHIGLGGDNAFDDRQPRMAEHILGALLVHRESRGEHAGMRVRQFEPLKQTLHTAIFAPTAMQAIQYGIGLKISQNGWKIAVSFDLDHAISAMFPQGSGACTPTGQGHLTLGRGATHQYRHCRGLSARLTHQSASSPRTVCGPYHCFLCFAVT